MRRRVPPWAGLLGGLLVLGWFGSCADRYEVCRPCLARRHTTERLLWTSVDQKGSLVLDETLGGNHSHDWGLNHEEDYTFGLKTMQSCGEALGNPVPHLYETRTDFRGHVLASLAAGTLRAEDWLAFCEVPRHAWKWPADRREAFRGRARQALALVVASGLDGQEDWQFHWWTREIEEADRVRK